MDRLIAHSDANCFYASVEMLRNPRLRGVPMAVCGAVEERHGIILTANYIAKRRGVRTGMAIWQARQVSPGLVTVPPHYTDYIQFSGFLRKIYGDYSDRVEGFGLDEAWVDLSSCASSFDEGEKIVREIRERVRRELGITVSIGLADNKVFAKLGSDLKKPDACTVIRPESFKDIVWPLPVGALLYVGRATEAKLSANNITTISALANTPQKLLTRWFGKIGGVLYSYANGLDRSPVADFDYELPVKSVGNSHTSLIFPIVPITYCFNSVSISIRWYYLEKWSSQILAFPYDFHIYVVFANIFASHPHCPYPFAQFQRDPLIDSDAFGVKRERNPVLQIVIPTHRPFLSIVSINYGFHINPVFSGGIFFTHDRPSFILPVSIPIFCLSAFSLEGPRVLQFLHRQAPLSSPGRVRPASRS
jgi:DNA polymerase-4